MLSEWRRKRAYVRSIGVKTATPRQRLYGNVMRRPTVYPSSGPVKQTETTGVA